jgi:hypothetical protein
VTRLEERTLNEVVALVLILLLAGSGYAAGRLHGQLSYRMGYRFGYRQGYFDGDRSSWNRRRRELQAAVASVLTTPIERRAETFPEERPTGTTYTSAGIDEPSDEFVEVPAGPPRDDWSMVDSLPRRT